MFAPLPPWRLVTLVLALLLVAAVPRAPAAAWAGSTAWAGSGPWTDPASWACAQGGSRALGGEGKAGWRWPLERPVAVVAEYAAPATRYSAGHRGVDLAAAAGAAVWAPASGTVVFAGVVVDRPVVSIEHAGGYRSSVEPVVATVPVGTVVLPGQEIGRVAGGGHCGGSCLHFGVRLNGEYVNPRGLMGEIPRAILLPLSGAGSGR